MDCLRFAKWLENRDTFDVSEADIALKHTAKCEECKLKLEFDEKLDEMLFAAMKPVKLPSGLIDKVDLSLDRVQETGSRRRYGLFGAVSAMAAFLIVIAISFVLTSKPGIPSMDVLAKHVIADNSHHGDAVLVVRDPANINQLGDFDISYDYLARELPSDYKFIGARICPLGECQSMHLVYLDNGKRVSVYLVKAKDVGFSLSPGKKYTVSSDDQTVSFWKKGRYVIARVG